MATIFRMRGLDPDCATVTYRYWDSPNQPDFSGASYVGPRCGATPLSDITIVNSWFDIIKNILISGQQAAGIAFSGFYDITNDGNTATINIGSPTQTSTVNTVNGASHDFIIPLTENKLSIVSYRVVGKIPNDGSSILREGSKAVRRESSFISTLRIGGSGTENFGELGETGIIYTNDTNDISTANIVWHSTDSSGITIRVTGALVVTVNWTLEVWKKEY